MLHLIVLSPHSTLTDLHFLTSLPAARVCLCLCGQRPHPCSSHAAMLPPASVGRLMCQVALVPLVLRCRAGTGRHSLVPFDVRGCLWPTWHLTGGA